MDVGGVLVAIIVIFLLCVLINLLWIPAHEWNIYLLLKQRGIPSTAHVVERTVRGSRGQPYFITYTIDDPIVSKTMPALIVTQNIGREKYQLLYDNAKVNVRYLPTAPNISRLSDLDEDWTLRNRASLIAVAAFVVFPPLVLLFVVIFILDRFATKQPFLLKQN